MTSTSFSPGAVLAWVAVLSLALSLGSTIGGLWAKWPETSKDFFELTKLLLSWQVVAGGLAGLGVRKFDHEIKGLLGRIGGKHKPVTER